MSAYRWSALRLASISCFILLMLLSCLGCKRGFDSSKGLQIHQKSCKEYLATTRRIFAKRTNSLIQRDPSQSKCVRTGILEDVSIRRAGERSDCLEETSSDTHAAVINNDIGSTPNDRGPSPNAAQPSPPRFRTRVGRKSRIPLRYTDYLPSSATPLGHLPQPQPTSHRRSKTSATVGQIDAFEAPQQPGQPGPELAPAPTTIESETVETLPNNMGLYRIYSSMPTLDPDDTIGLADVCDSPSLQSSEETSRPIQVGGSLTSPSPSFAPFPNITVSRLMRWWYAGSGIKSAADLDGLVKHVLLKDDFDAAHLRGFSTARECARLDTHEEKKDNSFPPSAGWREHSVKIRVPAEYQIFKSEDDAPQFEVPGVYVRDLVDVIHDAFQDPTARTFHMTPYQHFWKPTKDAEPIRIYSELYCSDAMLQEHEKIRRGPRELGCTLETAVAAIMLWSDSTNLANFGKASLWPIYAYFGNQSKYNRAKPTAFASHHLAYIPSLPDSFEDFYAAIFGSGPTPAVRTHCKRELMHAVWTLLLNPEFMHAYEHGLVIRCADGITRRIYPRFFTYSADYPEKVLLATIKYLARCPCPRCLIQKDQIPDVGSHNDQRRRENLRIDCENRQANIDLTRSWIFERGYPVDGPQVKGLLDPVSGVPIRNAFSHVLLPFGFNFFTMFVPDLLHEFELGVWKQIFTHLIRILYAIGGDVVQRLNKRYRQTPTFGQQTIRRFTSNVSEMKNLAGRDFEDILQCAIPAFEGLLPSPHDAIVSDLLFDLATWHASAKLRLHTESTLQHLENTTASLGRTLRRFVNITCNAFVTNELPREVAARSRRRAAASSRAKTVRTPASANAAAQTSQNAKKPASPGRKLLNLCTYKIHALADYANTIRQFGTSDSYSTQVGELEHRRVKRFFARTNKNLFTRQITRHERRERILQQIGQREAMENQKIPSEASPASESPDKASTKKSVSLGFQDSDPLPYTDPAIRYHLSYSTQFKEDISSWLGEHKSDPAFQNFLPRLKDHILARLLEISYDGDEHEFSDAERRCITFVNNRIYRHKVVRVNYTTYDIRRAQDSLNPRTHADFMCLSREDANSPNYHPYWYGRIVGIFHAFVRHIGPHSKSTDIQRVDFLWVRWFGIDPASRGGWASKRLHRIGFFDSDQDSAFGFLDPAVIIRAVHLIPAFLYGKTTDLLGPSIVRQPCDEDEDWAWFYIDIFIDRDMFMRFLGGGIGHKSDTYQIQASTEIAEEDTTVSGKEQASCGIEEDPEEPSDDEMDFSASEYDTEHSDFCDPEDGEGNGDEITGTEGYDAL